MREKWSDHVISRGRSSISKRSKCEIIIIEILRCCRCLKRRTSSLRINEAFLRNATSIRKRRVPSDVSLSRVNHNANCRSWGSSSRIFTWLFDRRRYTRHTYECTKVRVCEWTRERGKRGCVDKPEVIAMPFKGSGKLSMSVTAKYQ